MEQIKSILKRAIESKVELRKQLAALPFEKKVQIVLEMRKRREQLLKSVSKTDFPMATKK